MLGDTNVYSLLAFLKSSNSVPQTVSLFLFLPFELFGTGLLPILLSGSCSITCITPLVHFAPSFSSEVQESSFSKSNLITSLPVVNV